MKIEEYGKPEGSSILCVPGVFMSGDFFSRLAEQMPEYHFVCVTLDGFHPGCEEFTGLEPQVEKLVGLLVQRNLTRFELAIGLSMGTIFAVKLAKREELSIKKLFLDGAVSFYESKHPKALKAAMYLIFSYFRKTAKDEQKSMKSLQKIYTEDWAKKSHLCRKSLSKPSLKVIVRLLAEYRLEPGITQPMYLLFGAKEDNITINSRTVKELYPSAKITVQPGYNHLGYLDHEPEHYAEMIRRVLADKS